MTNTREDNDRLIKITKQQLQQIKELQAALGEAERKLNLTLGRSEQQRQDLDAARQVPSSSTMNVAHHLPRHTDSGV